MRDSFTTSHQASNAVACARPNPTLGDLDSLIFEAFGADPVGKVLFGKLNASPLVVGAAFFLAVCAVFILSLLLYVFAFSPTVAADFLSWLAASWSVGVYWILVVPLVMAFYAWISIESGQLFGRMYSNGVFEATESDFQHAVVGASESVRSLHISKAWSVAATLVVLAVILGWVVGDELAGYAAVAEPLGRNVRLTHGLSLPIAATGVYMVCMIAARELSTVIGLWRVFRAQNLRLRPLHPDRCGGLGPLNRFALTFAYFLALAGFGLALVSIQSQADGHFLRDYMLHVGLGIYAVLAPLTFFGMLGAAHRAMADAKNELIA